MTARELVTADGTVICLDAADYDRVAGKRWIARGSEVTPRHFWFADGKQRSITLPRFILGVPARTPIIYADGDRLNCRRANLQATDGSLAAKLIAYSEDGPNGCRVWTRCRDKLGYGLIQRKPGRSPSAHKNSYETFVGPVPEGLVLDHLCRNPSCINPAHLEPVPQRENVLRGISLPALNAKKTHCVHGHPLSGDNVIIVARERDRRICVTCKRAFKARWRAERKARGLPA